MLLSTAKIKKKCLFVSGLLLIVLCTCVRAQTSPCHGRLTNPITDICWSCLFPLTIGNQTIVTGRHADTKNPSNPVCRCPANPGVRLGLSLGYWEPVSLVDVTRTPFCFTSLGGMQLPMGDFFPQGVETVSADIHQGFYHVHWYRYPLIILLNLLTEATCMDDGSWDVAYLTELDPSWTDDHLAFLLAPETLAFANPIAQASCAGDAIAASTKHAIDAMPWCLGAQGSAYPLTGTVAGHAGGVEASTLLTERLAFKLHRELLLKDSSTKAGKSLCREHFREILPKSRYRYQMVYPVAASEEPMGCKPFGHTTLDWGMGREFPYKGEDFGYLVWKKRNCCA